jgi:hypothetical protein
MGKHKRKNIPKKIVYGGIIFIILITLLFGFYNYSMGKKHENTNNNLTQLSITVYKSMYCGCCGGYIEELKKRGFIVSVIETENIDEIKEKYGIPKNLQSCHTSLLENYIIEGHVPFEAIELLLKVRPEIEGIALPGMPQGSVGMPGKKMEPFTIYSFTKEGFEKFMII